MIFQDLRFFPKKFSRKASYSESNKLIHSGQFVKIPFRTYVRLLDSLEYCTHLVYALLIDFYDRKLRLDRSHLDSICYVASSSKQQSRFSFRKGDVASFPLCFTNFFVILCLKIDICQAQVVSQCRYDSDDTR